MNKLILTIALGSAGIALAITTTVATNTVADGTITGLLTQSFSLTEGNTDVDNTITQGTATEASIEIVNADSTQTLGTINTITTIDQDKSNTTINNGSAHVEVSATKSQV